MDIEQWITPEFLIKRKIRLFNWKRKFRILKKDSEDLQKDKVNLKKKLSELLQTLEKYKMSISQKQKSSL